MAAQGEDAVAGSGESAGGAQPVAVLRRPGVTCAEGRLTLAEVSARVREAYAARSAASLLRARSNVGRISEKH